MFFGKKSCKISIHVIARFYNIVVISLIMLLYVVKKACPSGK